MITLQGHIKPRIMWTFWPIKFIPWYKLCSQMATVSSKTTMPPFTQLKLSRTGLLSTRMLCHIFPDHHSHQILTLLNLCNLHWREKCVLAIHSNHHYLNLPPFCRKNGTKFIWQAYRNCIYPFQEDCKLFWMPMVSLCLIKQWNMFFS